jgi:hypothetical protein
LRHFQCTCRCGRCFKLQKGSGSNYMTGGIPHCVSSSAWCSRKRETMMRGLAKPHWNRIFLVGTLIPEMTSLRTVSLRSFARLARSRRVCSHERWSIRTSDERTIRTTHDTKTRDRSSVLCLWLRAETENV